MNEKRRGKKKNDGELSDFLRNFLRKKTHERLNATGEKQYQIGAMAGLEESEISRYFGERGKGTFLEVPRLVRFLKIFGLDLAQWIKNHERPDSPGLAAFLNDPRSKNVVTAEHVEALRALDRMGALGDEKDVTKKWVIICDWAGQQPV